MNLHADNCIGQNKNNIVMHYLMWLIMTSRNKTIEISSFMVSGHTKFAPDRFFGVLKKKFRHSFVSTLDELVDVVKKSMIAGQNIPQLTKNNDERFVVWNDWKSFLSRYFHSIKGITRYHHFRFSASSPGIVFVRILHDSEEEIIKISPESIAFDGFPSTIYPKGMDIDRQWYLYNEIAPFCSSSQTAALTCPRPCDIEGVLTPEEDRPTTKRKRTCSHCHKEGHTKTKKGKISCPELI